MADASIFYKTQHSYQIGNNPYATIKTMGTILGCGVLTVRGVKNITKENFEEVQGIFRKINSDYRGEGIGAIYATLGDEQKHIEPFLLKLGFEKVSEYHSYLHGPYYMQRLYVLKV